MIFSWHKSLQLVCVSTITFGFSASLGQVMSDGDFSNWSDSYIAGSGSSAYMTRYETGGNPGAYITSTTITGWADDLMANEAASWSPGTNGPITSVAMSIDVQSVTGWGQGQGIYILAYQDGKYYSGPCAGPITGSSTSWHTMELGPYQAADFSYLDRSVMTYYVCGDTTKHPDFSSTGSPLKFGFITRNGSSGTYTQKYDNWRIDLIATPLPVYIDILDNAWQITQGESLQVVGRVLNVSHQPIPGVEIGVEDPVLMQSLPNVAVTDANGVFTYSVSTTSETPSRNYYFKFFAGTTGTCYSGVAIAVLPPDMASFLRLENFGLRMGVQGTTPLNAAEDLVDRKLLTEFTKPRTAQERTIAAIGVLGLIRDGTEYFVRTTFTDWKTYVGSAGALTCFVPTGVTQAVTCPVGIWLVKESLHDAAVESILHVIDISNADADTKTNLRTAVRGGDFIITVVTFDASGSTAQDWAEASSLVTAELDALKDLDGRYEKIVLAGSNSTTTQGFILTRVHDCNHNGIQDEMEPDSDGDGVIDDCDLCPNTPPNTFVDEQGCPTVGPDLNRDGHVDQNDAGIFWACSTGPASSYTSGLPLGCLLTPASDGYIAADFDHDGDVDQADFGVFQCCYSGPNKPVNPSCAN